MSAIAWWIIPAVATLLAIAYVSWRARPRPPEDTHDAIQAREAFKRVMEEDRRRRHGPGGGRSLDGDA
jgi:type VI protein secretion system component VasK